MQPLTKVTILGIRLGVIALAVYWATMFVGTHTPKLPGVVSKPNDKLLHFVAYFGLGILLCYVSKPAKSWRRFGGILVLGLLYGAFDELTQSLVPNRYPDWRDLIADAMGLTTAVAVYWVGRSIVRRIRDSRADSPVASSKA
jgi:VanZ family protein